MIQICLLSFISDFGIRISNFFDEGGLLDLMSMSMSRARVIHIVTTLPRTLSQAELIEQIKKISSKWIKTIDTRYRGFLWQRGYGRVFGKPEPARCRAAICIDATRTPSHSHVSGGLPRPVAQAWC